MQKEAGQINAKADSTSAVDRLSERCADKSSDVMMLVCARRLASEKRSNERI